MPRTRCRRWSPPPRPARSGATSGSSSRSPWPRSASGRRPCAGVPPDPACAVSPRSSLFGMPILRQPLLLLARSGGVKRLVSAMPVSAGIVRSYVPGERTEDAVHATADLVEDHLRVTLDYLGEDTHDADQADATVAAYLDVLEAL